MKYYSKFIKMNYLEITAAPIKDYFDSLKVLEKQGREELNKKVDKLTPNELFNVLNGASGETLMDKNFIFSYSEEKVVLQRKIKQNLMLFLEKNEEVIKADNFLIFLSEIDGDNLLCFIEKNPQSGYNDMGFLIAMDKNLKILSVSTLSLYVNADTSKIEINLKPLKRERDDYFNFLNNLSSKKIIKILNQLLKNEKENFISLRILFGNIHNYNRYKTDIEKLLIDNQVKSSPTKNNNKI